jgi:phosphatidate phosphatase APP1
VEAEPRGWTAHVHGWIFEKERDGDGSTLRELLRARSDLSEEDARSALFRERAALFLVDNERAKAIPVEVAGRTITLPPSGANGHFTDTITVGGADRQSGELITVRAVTRPTDARPFTGEIQLIGRRGVSVVSDIDDTIKVSNVADRRELIANTFLRPFQAAPGMAELYRGWASGGNVAFHYVSASPWQLYPPLADFVRLAAFPKGSFHLRPFRLKDQSGVDFLTTATLEYKLGVIERLLRLFPERRFVLVGDSGEKDPEVYATLATRFPGQVAAILIRDVSPERETLDSPRFATLYAPLPAHVLRRVFRDTGEVADVRLHALAPP